MHKDIPAFEMLSSEMAAEQLRILGDPTRLKLVWAMAQGETSVACLAEVAGVTPTGASQHLAKLRMTGLVRARREGTFMFYTLENENNENNENNVPLLDFVLGGGATVASRAALARSR